MVWKCSQELHSPRRHCHTINELAHDVVAGLRSDLRLEVLAGHKGTAPLFPSKPVSVWPDGGATEENVCSVVRLLTHYTPPRIAPTVPPKPLARREDSPNEGPEGLR